MAIKLENDKLAALSFPVSVDTTCVICGKKPVVPKIISIKLKTRDTDIQCNLIICGNEKHDTSWFSDACLPKIEVLV